jgi:2,4-dienoyl-CoA reductase-like NADH-dependent reductase (Old Yellow Enzyme family)
MASAFEPLALGRLALRNRLIKTATYEGMVVDGAPSEVLARHHEELAEGGVGMTTVAYASVSPEGRTFAAQMVMRPEIVAPLRALTDRVHRAGAAAMLQLGHAGGFSKNTALGVRGPAGPSLGFNAYGALSGMPIARAMTEDDLSRTRDDFVRAARLSFEAGFDAVELHLGHGYLLSQFLSPHRNGRRDRYGGSLEGRMRYPLEVVRAVRAALGPEAPIFVKTNLDDGVPGGLGVEDCIAVCRALEDEGVTAVVLSGGLVSHSAFFLLRGERPLRSMIEVEKSAVQKLALRLFGPIFVPVVPYAPTFFLPLARKVRAAVKLPLVYLGGATSLAELEALRADGFELIAMGRALLREPDLLRRYQRGEAHASRCTHCNECVAEMDRPGGVACREEPWQLERRAREVAEKKHLAVCR